jgi:hypothetical protein
MLPLLAACPGSETTPCGDLVCQKGFKCDAIHELCVVPSQLTSCLGQPNGAACYVGGSSGYVCDREVCIPSQCGDGIFDAANEDCDGSELGSATCASQGYLSGVLACSPTCRFDVSGCQASPPVITSVEGTGVLSGVTPRPEDVTAYESVPAADRRTSSRRVSGTEQTLMVGGANLAGVTSATATGQAGQGTIQFEIQPGGTETMVTLKFPQTMTVTAGGLFVLALVAVAGTAEAQVFFLQGQDGTCSNTVTGDLTVSGNVTITTGNLAVGGTATFASASVAQLAVTDSYSLPPGRHRHGGAGGGVRSGSWVTSVCLQPSRVIHLLPFLNFSLRLAWSCGSSLAPDRPSAGNPAFLLSLY